MWNNSSRRLENILAYCMEGRLYDSAFWRLKSNYRIQQPYSRRMLNRYDLKPTIRV